MRTYGNAWLRSPVRMHGMVTICQLASIRTPLRAHVTGSHASIQLRMQGFLPPTSGAVRLLSALRPASYAARASDNRWYMPVCALTREM